MDIDTIEARYKEYLSDRLGNLDMEHKMMNEDVPWLIAEVRRFKALEDTAREGLEGFAEKLMARWREESR
jgi:hypothetical protein